VKDFSTSSDSLTILMCYMFMVSFFLGLGHYVIFYFYVKYEHSKYGTP